MKRNKERYNKAVKDATLDEILEHAAKYYEQVRFIKTNGKKQATKSKARRVSLGGKSITKKANTKASTRNKKTAKRTGLSR